MRGYHSEANGVSSLLGYNIVLNSKELPEFRTSLLPLKKSHWTLEMHTANFLKTPGHKRYTRVLISPYPDQEGNKLQRQKILVFIYPIYNHNWRNISTIYIPYILESNPHPNLIRTSFYRFLKRKKKKG